MSATIKTFRAPDALAALAMVKAALGPDAVILSTRKVTSGVLRRAEVEVTAGMPSTEPAPAAAAAKKAYGKTAAVTTPAPAPTARAATPAPIAAAPQSPLVSAPVEAPLPAPVVADEPSSATGSTAPAVDGAPTFADLLRAPVAEAAARGAGGGSHEPVLSEISKLRDELEQFRKQMQSRGAVTGMDDRTLPKAAKRLRAQLIECGLELTQATELVQRACEKARGRNANGLEKALRLILGNLLAGGAAPWKGRGGREIIAFVGPTGAGKTTTLAKVAARAILERRKVALITLDTYRIGATSQITRYGEIMRSPTFVARDREELVLALSQCETADLVLIDTAGRSTSEAVAKQAEQLRSVQGVELILCASAVGSPADLRRVAERYKGLTPSRLIITKLDESASPAGVLALTTAIERPIAAICEGQRVPEDIQNLSSAELFERLLGDFSKTSVAGTVAAEVKVQ